MARKLRVQTALPEDLDWIPNTPMAAGTLFWPLWVPKGMWCLDKCAGKHIK